jgi:DNA-binding NtrC family response regulator
MTTTSKRPGRVLIVDDEPNYGRILLKVLRDQGFDPTAVTSAEEALQIIQDEPPDAVLSDIRMPGMDGMALLEVIRKNDPEIAVVLMTAYGTHVQEERAKQLGAYHYLRKPFENQEVVQTVRLAMERRELLRKTRDLTRALEERYSLDMLRGKNQKMQQVFELILKVAPTDANVLVIGENGTGKELVARAIHSHSGRDIDNFQPINCSALSPNLIESELFGHEKGAFTDARDRKRGLFEVANGGTVFLDEVGDMPYELQAKVLRVLESREFRRVGGVEPIQTDFRLVSATNQDLEEKIKEGGFREDLYHRINVMTLGIPPLRERPDDIPLLSEHFIRHFNQKRGRMVAGVSPEAMRVLMDYKWPGNVRELENTIEHALVLRADGYIEVSDLPDRIAPEASASGFMWSDGEIVPYKVAKEAFERRYFAELLSRNDYNVSRAAITAGLSRRHLQEKLKQYGLRKARDGTDLKLED